MTRWCLWSTTTSRCERALGSLFSSIGLDAALFGSAADFLPKPFREQDMLDAVTAAIERDRKRREGDKASTALQAAHATLTARERRSWPISPPLS